MKFRLIEEEKSHHSDTFWPAFLGLTRAGDHAWQKREPLTRAQQDERLKVRIQEIHEASFGIYGAPRVQAELLEVDGLGVSKKRVARLMRELKIKGVSRRGRRRTPKSESQAAASPDLVQRKFTAAAPDELWVADITYVPTWEGYRYLNMRLLAEHKREKLRQMEEVAA